METNLYTITLRHDEGCFRIQTAAGSEQAARAIIRNSENCPDCAINSVRNSGPVCPEPAPCAADHGGIQP